MADVTSENFVKNMTQEQAKAFVRKVLGPPSKFLEGDEKEKVLLMLAMTQPWAATTNQISWTNYYTIGETEYHVTQFSDFDEVVVEKMLKEEQCD